MVTTQEVKNYLRIPDTTDDNYIAGIICAGYNYLENAVDDFEEKRTSSEKFEKLADTWVLTQWCPTMYDQREGMTAGDKGLGFVARSLITQLQLFVLEEVG